MANAHVNKVVYGGTTLIDLTGDDVTAASVLSGKKFHLKSGAAAIGTIASQAAQTITPGTSDQTIAAGKYLSGAQTIKGDANLLAGNIKSGVSIFGVSGSYSGIDTSNLVLFEVSWKKSRYLNPAGELKSNSNYNLSSYIPASPSTTYSISVMKNSTTDTGVIVSCFNGTSHIEQLVPISATTDTGTKTGTFTTPANCTCIRLSVGKNMSQIKIA